MRTQHIVSARHWSNPPAADRVADPIGVGWSPTARGVDRERFTYVEDRFHDCPRRVEARLTAEERAITLERVAEQPLVRTHFVARFPVLDEIHALADHGFASCLDPRAERDRDVRPESKDD